MQSLNKSAHQFIKALLVYVFLTFCYSITADAAWCVGRRSLYASETPGGFQSSVPLIVYQYNPQSPEGCSTSPVLLAGYEYQDLIKNKIDQVVTSSEYLNQSITQVFVSIKTLEQDLSALKTEVKNLQTSPTSPSDPLPYDYTSAALFYSVALSSVIALWLISRSAGTIIDAIRHF